MADCGTIYTIGHSTHEIDWFLDLLSSHGISAVADVRSTPASRFNPQFNRDPLKSSLDKVGIDYVFLGRELGARSTDRSSYVDGRVQYDRLAQAPSYLEGLARLDAGRTRRRIALMCSERDPLDCHRAVLISESLVARGTPIVHILGDGTAESHAEYRLRLRALHGLADDDLFHSTDELVEEALARQEARIAFTDDQMRGAVD